MDSTICWGWLGLAVEPEKRERLSEHVRPAVAPMMEVRGRKRGREGKGL